MDSETIRSTCADTLSAADIFGDGSRLLLQSQPAASPESAMLDSLPFQAVMLAVAVVYMFFLVRYSDIIWGFIRTAVSADGNALLKESGMQFSSEQRNLSIVMSLIGIIMTSFVSIRLLRWLRPSLFDGAAELWIGCGVAAAAIAATMAAVCAVLYIAGAVSGRRDACMGLIRIKTLCFAVGVSVITPFCISYLLLPENAAGVWLYAILALCSVSALLFVKKSFLLFISQRISILFWILYLCTLEIFPISLLLSPFLRGDGI